VVEVKDPRLYAILQIRRLSLLSLHFLIQFKVKRTTN